MKLIKCPRCELNYMYENEGMCSVCRKDVRGEPEPDDMIELCSECGENPVIPGQEVCAFCLKELQRRSDEGVDDGVTGYIVPVRDAAALTEAVEKLLSLTREERAEMGLRGRRKMEREFDRRTVTDAYLSTIE